MHQALRETIYARLLPAHSPTAGSSRKATQPKSDINPHEGIHGDYMPAASALSRKHRHVATRTDFENVSQNFPPSRTSRRYCYKRAFAPLSGMIQQLCRQRQPSTDRSAQARYRVGAAPQLHHPHPGPLSAIPANILPRGRFAVH